MQISEGGDAATCRSRGVLQFKLMQFGLSVHAQRQAYVLCRIQTLLYKYREGRDGVSSCDECVLCFVACAGGVIFICLEGQK